MFKKNNIKRTSLSKGDRQGKLRLRKKFEHELSYVNFSRQCKIAPDIP